MVLIEGVGGGGGGLNLPQLWCVSWNIYQASCVAASHHRQTRSGGYPKFPLHEYQPPTCGTRDVTHEPSRVGQPAAKIVGGSVAPYGAYPWQVGAMTVYGMFPC
jgi:hypothetical protein